MDGDHLGLETRRLLERADRAIEESIRLRALNAEVRRQLRQACYDMERQLAEAFANASAAIASEGPCTHVRSETSRPWRTIERELITVHIRAITHFE
ncbi:hypothetical protein P0R31_28605 [Bradyrhizobium yuanmingense]|uniref:hypothetical protein n=1 Tax=Bradyrhizobium yuanmingense TaxID=108015 RepID=UPI0023B8ADE0|nr:hypothetical protein [Bradyrhizobium yuanmingense]MDF0521212.1 hypothetical protein [Bradyrhizobium yuanmingense]